MAPVYGPRRRCPSSIPQGVPSLGSTRSNDPAEARENMPVYGGGSRQLERYFRGSLRETVTRGVLLSLTEARSRRGSGR